FGCDGLADEAIEPCEGLPPVGAGPLSGDGELKQRALGIEEIEEIRIPRTEACERCAERLLGFGDQCLLVEPNSTIGVRVIEPGRLDCRGDPVRLSRSCLGKLKATRDRFADTRVVLLA